MPSVARDIGHGTNTWERDGGKGVRVNGVVYEEHDFNSKLAVELDKHLKRNGIDIVEIQKPFSPEVSLTERTNYYNRLNVDLVWSLHANAGASNAKGICAFYWHDHEQSKRAAELFVDELKKAGFDTHGNGLHASITGSWTDLHIVRETKMAAVLTENGFMTNPDEFKNIFGENQGDYIKRLAVVHAKAICRYFGINYKEGDEPIPDPSDLPKVTSFSKYPRLIEITRDTGMYQYANLSHSKGTARKGTRIRVYGETYAAWVGGGGVFIQKKDSKELPQTIITGGLTKNDVDKVEQYFRSNNLEGSLEFVGKGNPYAKATLKGDSFQEYCEWLDSNDWWYKVQ
jgi:N-acetylmuramoyl-L-alanine amidase